MEQENQEEKINEAITREATKADDDSESDEAYSSIPETAKKKGREHWVEMILFFILGVLVGIAMKTEAVKKVTVGFDDYKMRIERQDYDINKLQADAAQKRQEQENAAASSDSADENGTDASGQQSK